MAVSRSLRFTVLRRDGYRCRYCGDGAPDVKMTVDHVLPVALGGADTADNLVAACQPCNSGKSSSAPDEPTVAAVSDADLAWAAAIKQAAEIRSAENDGFKAYLAEFEKAWSAYRRSLPYDYAPGVRRFYESGLPVDMMVDAVDIALQARGVHTGRFEYFCGVCWRRVNDIQETAKEIFNRGRAG